MECYVKNVQYIQKLNLRDRMRFALRSGSFCPLTTPIFLWLCPQRIIFSSLFHNWRQLQNHALKDREKSGQCRIIIHITNSFSLSWKFNFFLSTSAQMSDFAAGLHCTLSYVSTLWHHWWVWSHVQWSKLLTTANKTQLIVVKGGKDRLSMRECSEYIVFQSLNINTK